MGQNSSADWELAARNRPTLSPRKSSPSCQSAQPDHPLVSPFLDLWSPLISCSPTEPYPSRRPTTPRLWNDLNFALFFAAPSSFPITSHHLHPVPYLSPQGFPLKTKMSSLQKLSLSSDHKSSHSPPKRHPIVADILSPLTNWNSDLGLITCMDYSLDDPFNLSQS